MKILTQIKPKEKYAPAFFLGLVIAAGIFLPFLIMGKGYFTYLGDFNVQQIPFYQHAHDYVKSAGGLGWDFYTDLGANFVSSYSFYLLGSPFFLITLLFPNHLIPYLMAPLLILKFALATLTAYAYITKFVKNKNMAIIGGLLYSFSGFSLYNVFFNHFSESIAFFPLMLIALEDYMEKGRKGFFAFSVFLNAITNYFFFFGQVVFLIIYFIIRTSMGDFKVTKRKFFSLALESVVGVGMACVILIPSILGILSNPRVSSFTSGWSLMMYNTPQKYFYIFSSLFFPPELPHILNFFPDSGMRWKSVSVWFPLVGMVGVISFLLSKKRHFVKRILAVSALMAFVPVLNSLFYALNSSYYARWFYMPILMMALASAVAFEDRKVNLKRGFRWQTGIIIFFIICLGLFPNGNTEGNFPLGLTKKPEVFWVYAGVTVISLLAFMAICLTTDLRRVSAFEVESFSKKILVVLSIFIMASSIIYIGYGKAVSNKSTQDIVASGIEPRGKIELPKTQDTENQFYRVDFKEGMDNQAMYWNLPSIQAFQSVVPGSIMEFYPAVGVKRDVGSRPELKHEGLRALLSVKYLLENEDIENKITVDGYKFVGTQHGFNLYEYENYIPMGFVYDEYMTTDQFEKIPEQDRDKALVAAILLTEEQIMYYGSGLIPADTGVLRKMNYESLSQEAFKRKHTAAHSFTYGADGFTAEINMKKSGLVFFSVPFEDGFSAKVDGIERDVEKVNVGFMAVFVEEGTHTVEFSYETPGLSLGATVSFISLVLLLAYLLIFPAGKPEAASAPGKRKMNRKKKERRNKILETMVQNQEKDEQSEVVSLSVQD